MEDNFIRVDSGDRETELYVNNKWTKDTWYYLYRGDAKTINDVIQNSLMCRYYSTTSSGKLIFIDNIGLRIEVDTRNKETRSNLKMMPGYLNSGVSYDCEPIFIEWYIERGIVFDTNFFKLGHCYNVRMKRNEDPIPMMLIDMDFDQIRFIYVKDDRRWDDRTVEYFTVSADKYTKIKNSYWFKAMMEGDVWSDDVHKEIAENK